MSSIVAIDNELIISPKQKVMIEAGPMGSFLFTNTKDYSVNVQIGVDSALNRTIDGIFREFSVLRVLHNYGGGEGRSFKDNIGLFPGILQITFLGERGGDHSILDPKATSFASIRIHESASDVLREMLFHQHLNKYSADHILIDAEREDILRSVEFRARLYEVEGLFWDNQPGLINSMTR